MTYRIYLRVSKKEQDEETQLLYCLRMIRQRGDKEFTYEVYRDKITSKKPLFKRVKKGDWEITTIPRVGAKQLFDELKKGDIIVAMRLDRLARNLYETTQMIDVLEKKEAEIILVTQPGIKNKIMLGVYAGMAEEEVKTLRARITEKLEKKRVKAKDIQDKFHMVKAYTQRI